MQNKIFATSMPTLRQLEYIVAVSKYGHFGQAARACAVSQPALSKQIQEVERLLGGVLFERARPKVLTTMLGKEVVVRAQQLLLDAQELLYLADTAKEKTHGRVVMGVIPTISPYFLPPLWLHVQSHYPHLEIILQEAQTDNLIDNLLSGQIDLALIALPVPLHGLHAFPLFDEPFVMAAPCGHSLDQEGSISELDLAGHELILMGDGHCLRDHALAVCSSAQGRMSAEIQAGSVTTLALMVQAGLGATLLPASSIPIEWPRAPNIRMRAFSDSPPPSRTIGLVWRPSAVRVPLFQLIGDCIYTILSAIESNIPSKIEGDIPHFSKVNQACSVDSSGE